MKILHLPESFFPWQTGGKEVFTLNLALALKQIGVDSVIAIHSDGSEKMCPGTTSYADLHVEVLPKLMPDPLGFYNFKVKEATGFRDFLLQLRPDVVHFHDQNGGASLTHLKIAKQLGFKTILTYHTAGQSCPQRALLFKGKHICDGKQCIKRCSECLLTIRSIPMPLPQVFSNISLPFLNNYNNAFHRIANIRTLVDMYFKSFQEIFSLHDKIQVHAHWVKTLLLLNGVKEEKIFFTRQGINEMSQEPRAKHQEPEANLKIIFIGRCDYIKGVHILIDAVKKLLVDAPVEVYFAGPYWENSKYGNIQLAKIKDDRRFKKPLLLPPDKVQLYMQEMDVCVIPSLCLETGPLIMLEALQCRLPIVGSNIGGIAELIEDGKNGLLFNVGDSKALADILELLIANPAKLTQLKNGIKKVRSVSDMANDFKSLYVSLCENIY